ncbi:hypothetical protein GCM10023310_50750 [Paenibacillus vulneris]|uniref:Phage holin family protein n=1 Tax=Paenibacillus vulneris TaxID=1133364 RepID=A0ABW3UJE8_9BACL|nr:phage holin family protein [Paenibacillus sp. 32352]
MKLLHYTTGALGAYFMTCFQFLYGDEPVKYLVLTLYVLLIVMDWIAGYRASLKDGSYASEYGIDGAFRSLFLLFVPAAGHLVDQIIGMPMVAFGFLTGAAGLHIWKSMTANTVRAGWDKWVPVWVMNAVADEIEHKMARAAKRVEEKKKYLDGDES